MVSAVPPGRASSTSSPASCGAVCGSQMTIVGVRKINGRGIYNYGCAARQTRGETACSNKSTVAELRLVQSVLAEVRKLFTSPDYQTWIQEEAEEAHRARVRAARRDDERAALEGDVAAAEKRLTNIVEAIASLGSNDCWPRSCGPRRRSFWTPGSAWPPPSRPRTCPRSGWSRPRRS